MAIQNRRGNYSDFDPSKMVEGEFAVVKSGDPNTDDGTSVYISTATGTAKRVALYSDIVQEVQGATQEIAEELTTEINEGVAENVTAAQTAATNAQTAAETATQKAQAASESAEQAAETVQNIIDNTLTQSGKAADAKKTGDEIAAEAAARTSAINSARLSLEETIQGVSNAVSYEAETREAADADLKADLEQNYAQKDGVYPDLAAGIIATDKHTSDATPYLFRPTGGFKDVGTREYVDAVVGGTVAENQLLPDTAYEATGGTASTVDGVCTFTASASGQQAYKNGIFENNHVILAAISWKTTSSTSDVKARMFASDVNGVVSTSWQSAYAINRRAVSGNATIGVIDRRTSGFDTIQIRNVMAVDLTQMFGTTIADYLYSLENATAGAAIAKLREWGFDIDTYHEYNPGSLGSVSGVSAHETVGFNQWDESKTVTGWYISDGDGSAIAGTNSAHSDYIDVIGGLDYYIESEQSAGQCGAWYDSEKNFISGIAGYNTVVHAPQNAKYVRLTVLRNGNGNPDTFCFNLSDHSRNGEYEPYKKNSYPLDSTLTLRGIPKLTEAGDLYYDGDRYLPDGTVERQYGIVDLGTLDWGSYSTVTSEKYRFVTTEINTLVSKPSELTVVANIVCAKYPAIKGNGPYNNVQGIAIHTNGNIIVYDEDLATVKEKAFKAAMSGVYLVYELATPTTESAEPYTTYQVCDPDGTEEYVTTGNVPVGHETRYPENLRAKIEGLPWDFSSLIAPTEKTATASRNYTAGSLLIMNNKLYKVTANIANGGTITPNTNVTATTLSEIISALAQ